MSNPVQVTDIPASPTSILTEIRLSSFKSYRDASLPLGNLTVLVGRNGSGKSNALDALWVLARIASGDDLRDALDGSREGPSVRGGAAGCPPMGEAVFDIGCSAVTNGARVDLDVGVQVAPTVQIVRERLAVGNVPVLWTVGPRADSGDIDASWATGLPSQPPVVSFRATRLLTSQVLSRIPANEAGQRIHRAAAQVVSALQGVFMLDPVPHAMRAYVNERDTALRRDASNLSAAVGALVSDAATKQRLVAALDALNEQDVIDVGVERSSLGDVILALTERMPLGGSAPVSARSMSDGTLRFLAILTALLQTPEQSVPAVVRSADDAVGQTVMVIEELENGLHASQAATLIRLMRESVRNRRIRVLATAHSPAVLDALEGSEHRNVIVCQRDAQGWSTLRRLTDLEGYVRIAAMSSLGRAAEADRLREQPSSSDEPLRFLDDLLGGP